MSRRLELHEILVGVLGSRNVYFQPPPTVKMEYPCIIYARGDDSYSTRFANGRLYLFRKTYRATVVDKNPDSLTPDKMLALPYCRFERHYTADNLNHDVFILNY